MTRPRVKICGITRLEDANIAARLGADAIGFVFWPTSPRRVSVEVARAIAQALPAHVTRVGVFVDASPAEVTDVARAVGLHAVQLHGDEDLAPYRGVPATLIKATSLATDDDVELMAALPDTITPLVDAHDRTRRGGTGQRANWARAAALARRRPIMLAGGLSAENVGEAIATVQPWAIDVSSGVETAPGLKSEARLIELFAALEHLTRGRRAV